jgi:hypothetical protein
MVGAEIFGIYMDGQYECALLHTFEHLSCSEYHYCYATLVQLHFFSMQINNITQQKFCL